MPGKRIGTVDPVWGCIDPKQGLPYSPAMESLHEYVISQLQAAKGRWQVVANESGVSRRTIEKIARREVANPGVSYVEKLARYFRERDAA